MRGRYRPRDRSLHPRFALAGHAGHLPYLYVESVDETLARSRPTAARSSALRSLKATC